MFSLGIYFFITPNGLNSGGLIGCAQLFDYLIQLVISISESLDLTGIINILLNVPLFILAFRTISKEFCLKTLLSVIIQMLRLSILPKRYVAITPDMLSNVAFGSIIAGVGIDLTLKSRGCAGGIDILVVYLYLIFSRFCI